MNIEENNLTKECDENLISMAKTIQSLLAENGVEADIKHIRQGPRLNHVVLSLKAGCRYSPVIKLQDEIQSALNVRALRIEAPIPGYDFVGLEFPRRYPEEVTYQNTTVTRLSTLKDCDPSVKLPIVIGCDVEGLIRCVDLTGAPHLLVGGAREQGVSQFMHSVICGLVSSRSPEELQLILVDHGGEEFMPYAGLPHLVVPIIKDRIKIVLALRWAVVEMERRLKMMARARTRNIADFNNRNRNDSFECNPEPGMDFVLYDETRSLPLRLPYIVVVVNDIDDVIETAGVEIMCDIGRLTARGRAAGIHLVLTSQRSDAMGDFASIKFNIPMRVAFKTDTEAWSVNLIYEKGAESLLGDGDCLALSKDGLLKRIQTPAISDKEIESVVAEAMRRCRTEKYGATKMIEKRIAIGEDDLEMLEHAASEKRIGLETLVSDILHDYVTKMKGAINEY